MICLLLDTVTESGLSKTDLWELGMATKKLKLEEEAITEILVADTDSESGAEVSDVEEEEDEQQQIIQQASAQDKPQAATSGGVLPPWGHLKEGT